MKLTLNQSVPVPRLAKVSTGSRREQRLPSLGSPLHARRRATCSRGPARFAKEFDSTTVRSSTQAMSWTRTRRFGIARTHCTLDARRRSRRGAFGVRSSRLIAASHLRSDPRAAAQRTRPMAASSQASAGLTVDRRRRRSACMKRLIAFAQPDVRWKILAVLGRGDFVGGRELPQLPARALNLFGVGEGAA